MPGGGQRLREDFLLNIIAGLEFPSSGVVELDGEPVTGPGRDRTVMFRSPPCFRGWM